MRLSILAISMNKLTGTFPPSLFNISSLSTIIIAGNFINGSLPTNIGHNLPNLQALGIGGNQFYGIIPVSITNMSKLEVFDIPANKFEGILPYKMGNLQNLRQLNIERNSFRRNVAGDLDFITSLKNCSNLPMLDFSENNFGGELPNSIGNLSIKVRQLYMGSNKMFRNIPIGLSRLTNLYRLGMENNFGCIWYRVDNCFCFCFIRQNFLNKRGNMLSGQVPSILCNITSLYILLLQSNNLEGSIPSNLVNCQNLKILEISYNNLIGVLSPEIFTMSFLPAMLDLSYNSLTGSLPPEVGKLKNIYSLNVSYNKFLGPIPETLGDCANLEYLNMQGNLFQGRILPKLGSLKGIQQIDLSQNSLSGQIPKEFENLAFLNYLNLSFNNLDGEVPSGGVFKKPGSLILHANSKLCGGIPELQLPSCFIQKEKNGKLWIVIVVSMLFVVIVISALLFFFYRRKRGVKDSASMPLRDDKILRISYFELQRATSRFSPQILVGSGSFGVVYKGQLINNDKFVAVKVLNLQKIGAFKSFKTECNALRGIRHRNLVPLLTYCSSIDSKGHEFKALVYEFMEYGSLDMWLHPAIADKEKHLGLFERLNIAIDVAAALQYLHNHCGAIVVHCDLKPGNIILDDNLIAHVGDFGLARLLFKTTEVSSPQGTSSTIAIKGSIGYVAPDLHNFVKMNLSPRVTKIIDPCLDLPSEREENNEIELHDEGIEKEQCIESLINLFGRKDSMQKCVISLLKIGLKSSETSANDRIDMKEVMRQLHSIKKVFFWG